METKPTKRTRRAKTKHFDEKFTLRLSAAQRQVLARRAGGKHKVAAFVRGWIEGLTSAEDVSAA